MPIGPRRPTGARRQHRRRPVRLSVVRARVGNVVFDVPAPSLEAYRDGTRAIAEIYGALLGLAVTTRADFYRARGWPADDGDACDHLVLDDHGPSISFEPVHGAYAPVRWGDPDPP